MNDQDFLIKLGKRIATLRKAKGYSQLDLGSIIDMEKSNTDCDFKCRINAP